MAPSRIQRSRAKGWRMPENAVYVGRPTKWGNPFSSSAYTAEQRVALYRTAIMGAMPIAYATGLVRHVSIIELANARIDKLRCLPLRDLRGHDLACWCALVDEAGNPVPCHADVLLELANRDSPEGGAADA
jgi:hypothetical protein